MAKIYDEISRTFEYLLIQFDHKDCYPDNISLKTPLTNLRERTGDIFEYTLLPQSCSRFQ